MAKRKKKGRGRKPPQGVFVGAENGPTDDGPTDDRDADDREAAEVAAENSAVEESAAEDSAPEDTAAQDAIEQVAIEQVNGGDNQPPDSDRDGEREPQAADDAEIADDVGTEEASADDPTEDASTEDDEAESPDTDAHSRSLSEINVGADPFGADRSDRVDRTASCLWCGAERSIDEPVCPSCEHAWIDATIDEAHGGRLDTVATPQQIEQPRKKWRRRTWIPLALAAAAVAVYGAIFWAMWDNTGAQTPTAASTTQPSDAVTVPPATVAEPTTSPPPATTAAPTTTAPPTTTTTTTTTTTLPQIVVVEPPYDPAALTLGAFALGPIPFGSTDSNIPGRLAATFGQPTAQFPVGENWGLCPDDTARALEFGHLSLILRAEPDGEAVVGYRLRSETSGIGESPSSTLQSISGLGLGDMLSSAQELYSNVATSDLDDGTPIYLVLRSSDRRTLLWGELSTEADPEILSINSPRPCDGGPFGP